MTGTLYLVPTTLGGGAPGDVIPNGVLRRIAGIDYFIAENPKTARAFLKSVGVGRPIAQIAIERLDHNTAPAALGSLLVPLIEGRDGGLLSEAGCPAIADPGALLVRRAHERGLRVVPLTGPSSILLALIASGLESQRFSFHGYLPVKSPARERAIRELESRARLDHATQICIETPYRNLQLLRAILNACRSETLLCVATDLTLKTETVRTMPIRAWRNVQPDLVNRPSVFLLLSS